MIYTSYFAKMKKYPDMEFISVARFTPKGINISEIKELMPSEQLIYLWKGRKIDEKRYTEIYMEQLIGIDRLKLGNMLQGKCIVCYERSGTFCHRHIIADWLRSVGFEVEELK